MASNYPAGVTDAMIDELVGDDNEEAVAERAELAAAYERIKQFELERGGFSPSPEPADHVWTDQEIVEYEAWLAIAGQFPRIAPVSVAVRMPAEWEEAA
jgi:hypothetical protein